MTGSADANAHVEFIRANAKGRVVNRARETLEKMLNALEKELKDPEMRRTLDRAEEAGVDVTKMIRVRRPPFPKTWTDPEKASVMNTLIEAGWLTTPLEDHKKRTTYRLEIGRPCGNK